MDSLDAYVAATGRNVTVLPPGQVFAYDWHRVRCMTNSLGSHVSISVSNSTTMSACTHTTLEAQSDYSVQQPSPVERNLPSQARLRDGEG